MSQLSPAQVELEESKRKVAWLLLEAVNEGFDLGEMIGQLLASYAESGAGTEEAIYCGAAGLNRLAELLSHPEHIWGDLLPGGGLPPKWKVVEYEQKLDLGQFGENDVLPYDLEFHHGDDVFFCPNGAEFFTDNQGHQWIKFVPRNGRNAGSEHMFRVVPTQDYVVRAS